MDSSIRRNFFGEGFHYSLVIDQWEVPPHLPPIDLYSIKEEEILGSGLLEPNLT